MMKHLFFHAVLCGVGLLAMASSASAIAPHPVHLSGNTSYDEWTAAGLSAPANPGYPGYPGSGNWPNPIGSNLGGDAILSRISGGAGGNGPFPAGESLYFGGFSSTPNTFGGTVAISDSTIAFDLKTVVFQIEIAEAWTYDFWNEAVPTLSYNGGTQDLAPTFETLVYAEFLGTISMPSGEEALYKNLYAFQWDLSGISEPITSYSISWSGVQHAQVYGLRLDASSDVYSSAVLTPIPEPQAYALALFGLLLVASVVRHQRKLAA